MMPKTFVNIGEFKGKDVFEVRNQPGKTDDPEDWQFKKPVVSFGRVKARAILDHLEELKKFVEADE